MRRVAAGRVRRAQVAREARVVREPRAVVQMAAVLQHPRAVAVSVILLRRHCKVVVVQAEVHQVEWSLK